MAPQQLLFGQPMGGLPPHAQPALRPPPQMMQPPFGGNLQQPVGIGQPGLPPLQQPQIGQPSLGQPQIGRPQMGQLPQMGPGQLGQPQPPLVAPPPQIGQGSFQPPGVFPLQPGSQIHTQNQKQQQMLAQQQLFALQQNLLNAPLPGQPAPLIPQMLAPPPPPPPPQNLAQISHATVKTEKEEYAHAKQSLAKFTNLFSQCRQQLQGHASRDFAAKPNKANSRDPAWKQSSAGGESAAWAKLIQPSSSSSGKDRHGGKNTEVSPWHKLKRDEQDYLRAISKKVYQLRDNRERKEREQKSLERQASRTGDLRDAEPSLSRLNSAASAELPKANLAIQKRISESKRVAELFYLLNETNWNKFDDKFFLVNRRWFDRWKDFISYDYIVKQLVELGRPESELSINRLLSNSSNPGEINNQQIMQDFREYIKNRTTGMLFCNYPLKRDVIPERDLIFLSEPIWQYLKQIYGGEEIRRYAVAKNPASVLDRSPHLPQVLICLVLYEEAIRAPRHLVLPRKSLLRTVKGVVRESVQWLRDITDDNVRLWRLYPDVNHQDFLDQYNQQLKIGQLPELLKFPGFSLENSLDFFLEEYGTMQFSKHVIFCEVKKHNRGQWVFSLDFEDPAQFDEGATNVSLHRQIYGFHGDDAPQNYYSTYFKYHNHTTREYYQTEEQYDEEFGGQQSLIQHQTGVAAKVATAYAPPPEAAGSQYSADPHLHRKLSQMMEDSAHNPPANLPGADAHRFMSEQETAAPQNAPASQDSVLLRTPANAGDVSGEKRAATTCLLLPKRENTKFTLEIYQKATCNSCLVEQSIFAVIFCHLCRMTAYCSDGCRIKDQKFHARECQPVDVIKRVGEGDGGQVTFVSDDEEEEQTPSVVIAINKKALDRGLIEEITQEKGSLERGSLEKSKSQRSTIKEKRLDKADRKLVQQQLSTTNTQEGSKSVLSQKEDNNKEELKDADGSKRQKTGIESQTTSSGLTPHKPPDGVTEVIKPVAIRPATVPNTAPDAHDLAKLAAFFSMLTQIHPLRDTVSKNARFEQDPLLSGLRTVFEALILQDDSQGHPFSLTENPLRHYVQALNKTPTEMFTQLVSNLAKDNPGTTNQLISCLKTLQICINCGHQESSHQEVSVFELTNEREEFSQQLSVTLKVIYIFDGDQYRKYELRLRPGEYSYQDVISKIKEKVQGDRYYVKMSKRGFLLVDLYENSAMSQLFTNEQMKFQFQRDQSLTTFAYEVSKHTKEKVRKHHFIHIAKKAASGEVSYHSFPRLVQYNDQDPLKVIALKVLKVLKPLLYSSGVTNNPDVLEMQESDAYNVFFNQDRHAYDLIYVLKDGTRWKLDAQLHSSRKLNTVLDVANVLRFECILMGEASLQAENENYKAEIAREVVPIHERGLSEVEQCFKNTCRQEILTSEEMEEACRGCALKKGSQKQVEISRLGAYFGVRVNKVHPKQAVNHPIKLCLDRYTPRAQQWQTTSSVFDLVALVGVAQDTENAEVAEEPFIVVRQPSNWVKLAFPPQEKGEAKAHTKSYETLTSMVTQDPHIQFALYRKSATSVPSAPTLMTGKSLERRGTFHSVTNMPSSGQY